MSFLSLPFRLASRRNLDKSDVESSYGAIVQVIGGTYFVSGVSTGPVNGTLDYRNFDKNAGITNAFKASPNGLYSVQAGFLTLPAGTPQNSQVGLPFDNIGVNPAFQGIVTGVSFAYGSISNAVNSGTWQFAVRRQGVIVFISTVFNSLNLPVTGGTVTNITGLNFILRARDVLVLIVSSTVTVTDIVGIAWVKSLHVRG